MISSSLSKTALFFFLVLSSQLYCAQSQETTGETSTTGEADEGTTGEILSVSTTAAAGSGFAIPTPPPVTGDSNSPTTIITNWAPNGVKRQAALFTVNEEISSDNLQFRSIFSGPYQAFEKDVDGLEPETTYYFRVFLSSDAGVSDYSTVTAITTLAGPSGSATTDGGATNTTAGPGNSVEQEATQGVGQKQGGLSGGVIAGIVIAVIAVVAAIAAVVAKTAFASSAPVAGHWLDSAVQNPLYQAGEQAFENPMYEAPAEATA